MKLCDTCKNNNCSKKIVIEERENLRIIKCLEYEKDVEKIKSYTHLVDNST